jgi:branched-chain amino acid transport system permease protein
MAYATHLLAILSINVLGLLGLRWAWRWGGVVLLCQAALAGVGAYAFAIMAVHSIAIALLVSAFVATAAAVPLAWAVTRGRGRHGALVTLSYQVLLLTIFLNLEGVTGGAAGISHIPALGPWPRGPSAALGAAALAASAWILTWRIERSPVLLAVKATAEDPLWAASLGLRPYFYGMLPVLLCGAFSGLAGAAYAARFGFIDPSAFGLDHSISMFAAAVLAGSLPFGREVAAALLLLALPEVFRLLALPPSYGANLQAALFGLCLVLLGSRRAPQAP